MESGEQDLRVYFASRLGTEDYSMILSQIIKVCPSPFLLFCDFFLEFLYCSMPSELIVEIRTLDMCRS